jgi:hypothetical protein
MSLFEATYKCQHILLLMSSIGVSGLLHKFWAANLFFSKGDCWALDFMANGILHQQVHVGCGCVFTQDYIVRVSLVYA